MQRSVPVFVDRSQQFPGVLSPEFTLALLQKDGHDSSVSLETGLVQRRGAVVGDAAGVGPLVEQDLGDVEVVVSGCEVQRGALLNIFRLGRDTP